MKPPDSTGSVPEAPEPAAGVPPPISPAVPPPLPCESGSKGWGLRGLFSLLLTLCLVLFLADAIISFADGTLILLFNLHVLSVIQGLLLFCTAAMGLAIYALMGLTTIIPKRLFLPVALFNPVAGLLALLLVIYFHNHLVFIDWLVSVCQVLIGLRIMRLLQGGFRLQWPLVRQEHLTAGRFSWLNLCGFLLVNAFVLLPGVILYLLVCASLALSHFSDGFVTLRASGLTVQARKYVRSDGKRVQLFPMAHIGDAGFYQRVSESFPTNSIILEEGVSDVQNLLTNRLTYKRAAKALGLTEQQKEFKPVRGELVRADVDVEQFNTNTIAFLNLVTLFHTRGISAGIVAKLLTYSPPPGFEHKLWDDILAKRNEHLLGEIQSRLSQSDDIVVPWGAAHMPEIAKEIEKLGFHQEESRDYVVIRFGPR